MINKSTTPEPTMTTAIATLFYIKRTWECGKVDHLGPYLDFQASAVPMQRGQDQRKGHRITRWEWVEGKDS